VTKTTLPTFLVEDGFKNADIHVYALILHWAMPRAAWPDAWGAWSGDSSHVNLGIQGGLARRKQLPRQDSNLRPVAFTPQRRRR